MVQFYWFNTCFRCRLLPENRETGVIPVRSRRCKGIVTVLILPLGNREGLVSDAMIPKPEYLPAALFYFSTGDGGVKHTCVCNAFLRLSEGIFTYLRRKNNEKISFQIIAGFIGDAPLHRHAAGSRICG